jgi:hypothetical protein
MDEVSLSEHMLLELKIILQDDQFIKKDNEKLLPRQVRINDVTQIGSMYYHYNHSYN